MALPRSALHMKSGRHTGLAADSIDSVSPSRSLSTNRSPHFVLPTFVVNSRRGRTEIFSIDNAEDAVRSLRTTKIRAGAVSLVGARSRSPGWSPAECLRQAGAGDLREGDGRPCSVGSRAPPLDPAVRELSGAGCQAFQNCPVTQYRKIILRVGGALERDSVSCRSLPTRLPRPIIPGSRS